MRKEYNDRWNAELVNPGITHGEYMEQKALEDAKREEEKLMELFEKMETA